MKKILLFVVGMLCFVRGVKADICMNSIHAQQIDGDGIICVILSLNKQQLYNASIEYSEEDNLININLSNEELKELNLNIEDTSLIYEIGFAGYFWGTTSAFKNNIEDSGIIKFKNKGAKTVFSSDDEYIYYALNDEETSEEDHECYDVNGDGINKYIKCEKYLEIKPTINISVSEEIDDSSNVYVENNDSSDKSGDIVEKCDCEINKKSNFELLTEPFVLGIISGFSIVIVVLSVMLSKKNKQIKNVQK